MPINIKTQLRTIGDIVMEQLEEANRVLAEAGISQRFSVPTPIEVSVYCETLEELARKLARVGINSYLSSVVHLMEAVSVRGVNTSYAYEGATLEVVLPLTRVDNMTTTQIEFRLPVKALHESVTYVDEGESSDRHFTIQTEGMDEPETLDNDTAKKLLEVELNLLALS